MILFLALCVSVCGLSFVSAGPIYTHSMGVGQQFEVNADNTPGEYKWAVAAHETSGLFKIVKKGNHGGFWKPNLYTIYQAVKVGDKTVKYFGRDYHFIVS
jgi:hypothetical protein